MKNSSSDSETLKSVVKQIQLNTFIPKEKDNVYGLFSQDYGQLRNRYYPKSVLVKSGQSYSNVLAENIERKKYPSSKSAKRKAIKLKQKYSSTLQGNNKQQNIDLEIDKEPYESYSVQHHYMKKKNNQLTNKKTNKLLKKYSENSLIEIKNKCKQSDKMNNFSNYTEEPNFLNSECSKLNVLDSTCPANDSVIMNLFPKTFKNHSVTRRDNIENRNDQKHLSRNITQCSSVDTFKSLHNYNKQSQIVPNFSNRASVSNMLLHNLQKTKQNKSCATVRKYAYSHPPTLILEDENENDKRKKSINKGRKASKREILRNKKLLAIKLDQRNKTHNDDIYEGINMPNLRTILTDSNMTVDNSELSLNFTTPRPHSPVITHRKKIEFSPSSSESDVSYIEFNTNRKIADLYLYEREKRNKCKQTKHSKAQSKDGKTEKKERRKERKDTF